MRSKRKVNTRKWSRDHGASAGLRARQQLSSRSHMGDSKPDRVGRSPTGQLVELLSKDWTMASVETQHLRQASASGRMRSGRQHIDSVGWCPQAGLRASAWDLITSLKSHHTGRVRHSALPRNLKEGRKLNNQEKQYIFKTCYMRMSVCECILYMFGACVDQRRHQMPWNCSYRWLQATIWDLQKQEVLSITEPSSLALKIFDFETRSCSFIQADLDLAS